MNRKVIDKYFKDDKLDVIISFSSQTRYWFSKVQSSDGALFIEKDKADLFVDSRYIILANSVAKNCTVNLLKKGALQEFSKSKQSNYKVIGYESDYLTIGQFSNLKTLFPDAKFVSLNGQSFRNFKTEEEIKNIETAAKIGLKCFEKLRPEVVAGKTEKELAAKLEYLFKLEGAEKEGFDTIVASGVNGAKPHAVPSDKKLKNGELVTFDFGTYFNGYTSDTTRTIQVGEVTNKKLLEIYDIVKESQRRGIEAIKPGVTGAEIDKICRDYITEKGFGEYFGHGTGHGLGIEVHELPNTNSGNHEPLEPGHVVTVEPGIYIENLGGVRIEDDILVTETGHRILSKI